MRRSTKIVSRIVTAGVIVIATVLICPGLFTNRHARPTCHKQIHLAFHLLWNNQDGANPFPNVNGSGQDSIRSLSNQLASLTGVVAQNYNYVPGLKEDDPGELVLLYLKRPTRWLSHVAPRSIFSDEGWIVVPVDFAGVGPQAPRKMIGAGEMSERLSTEQFTNRLIATLNFLRTNDRPYWPSVVKEQTAFLDSLGTRD